jgi:hypothetical protein
MVFYCSSFVRQKEDYFFDNQQNTAISKIESSFFLKIKGRIAKRR